MGLAASQARMLFITARKSDVEFSQMRIAHNKMSLSRESGDLSDNYSRSLNMRKLVYALDGNATSATTTELSYGLLMTPNAANTASQYMLTDVNKRVVLSDSDCAKIGFASGAKNGTLGMDKTAFLAKFGLTAPKEPVVTNTATTAIVSGIDDSTKFTSYMSEQITALKAESFNSKKGSGALFAAMLGGRYTDTEERTITTNIKSALTNMNTALIEQDATLDAKISSITSLTLDGKTASDPKNQKQLDLWVQESAMIKRLIPNIANTLKVVEEQVAGEDQDGRQERGLAVANFILYGNSVKSTIAAGFSNESFANDVKKDLGYNSDSGASYNENICDDASRLITSYNTNKPSEVPKEDNKNSVSTDSQKIAFYTNLYNAISVNGWSRNSSIDDSAYLSTQLLNNNLQLRKLNTDGSWSQATLSDPSSPIRNVRDTEGAEEAKIKYDLEKDKIDDKEGNLDLQMKSLETERAALDTELDSVKAIITKNIERSFKTFA